MVVENQGKNENIDVEITYALPAFQVIRHINVPKGTTLENAIRFSGIVDQFPEIDLNKNQVGIFSKLSKRETILEANDRVEIYRLLLIDPKEARRLRGAKK